MICLSNVMLVGVVRGLKRVSRLCRNVDGLVEWKRPSTEPLGERFAFEQLHDQQGGAPRLEAEVGDLHDVAVAEGRRREDQLKAFDLDYGWGFKWNKAADVRKQWTKMYRERPRGGAKLSAFLVVEVAGPHRGDLVLGLLDQEPGIDHADRPSVAERLQLSGDPSGHRSWRGGAGQSERKQTGILPAQ